MVSLPRAIIGFLVAMHLAIGMCSEQVHAQFLVESRGVLEAAIETARGDLDAGRLPSDAVAKSQLLAQILATDETLASRTDSQNHANWMRYLNVSPLVAAIEQQESPAVIAERAEGLRGRLIGNIPGLEMTTLRSLRQRVDDLLVSLRYDSPDRAIEQIDQQLSSLANRLTQLGEVPSPDDAAALSALVGLFDDSRQAGEVVDFLRHRFSHPNLVILIGQPLVHDVTARGVAECRPIRDCILGTRIVGSGSLVGDVSSRLLPSRGRIHLELTLRGQFSSRSTGYNGPVRLRTEGEGTVHSSRSVLIGESGVALGETITSASLQTRITAIEHPLKLVRRVASKRAAATKPRADAIAGGRLRSQVTDQFAGQVSAAVASGSLGGASRALADGRSTLMRFHLPEPLRTLGSTEQAIYVEATQAATNQLGAVISAPAPESFAANGIAGSSSYNLAIQLHESLVDNVASRVLAGRRLTSKQIDQWMTQIGREVPAIASDDPSSAEPFEIDFSRLRPIIFEARDQRIKIGFRGTRFQQAGRELRRPLEVTATYEAVRTDEGRVLLERSGEVGVDFPGDGRLTIQQVAVKRSIQTSFGDRFPKTLLEKSLNVPTTAEFPALHGRQFTAQAVDARNGWLSITAR